MSAAATANAACTPGTRILFLLSTEWGSSVMRGRLMHSMLSQTREPRGAASEVVWVCSSCHRKPGIKMRPVLGPLNATLSRGGHGTAICVCVKFCHRTLAAVCASHGAPTLWDVIDNFRLFEQGVVRRAKMDYVDAYAVQTTAHANMLSRWAGRKVLVLPHPHGNVGGWSVAAATRPALRAVGFIYGDAA
eukprot:6437492-Prymnesium_polylepis.1